MPVLTLDGREVAYVIIRSARARRVRLRIGGKPEVEIVAPQRFRLPPVESILLPHRAWIFKHFDALAREPATPWQAVSGAVLPYLGEDCALQVSHVAMTVGVHADTGAILVRTPDASPEYVALVLEAWYRERARSFISERVAYWSPRMGVAYARISIKGQRTRWGSASSLGNLNFNWRLVMTPPAVIEYVVIHELAHLSVPDHSPKYWSLVEGYCPDRKRHQRWLREHGSQLAGILPSK